MNTFAWVLILAALILARAVYKGRVFNMGEDLSDAFLALVSNDTEKMKEVLARTGDSNTASLANIDLFTPMWDATTGTAQSVADAIGGGLDSIERKGNNSVALAAVILGGKAKGYRWGATGPDYYDCSGLIWAACKLTKTYTGTRFDTSSFAKLTKDTYAKVNDKPQLEDIVVWGFKIPYTTGHMGVVTGPDKFYSAMSTKSGIGEAQISTFRSYQPTVYRRTRFPSPEIKG